MSVVKINSNSYPYVFNGVYSVITSPPANTLGGANPQQGSPPAGVLAPQQVAGLVPVFPCCAGSTCDETTSCVAHFSFSFKPDCTSNANFNLQIPNAINNYIFSIPFGTTASGAETIINNVLPSGVLCSVVLASGVYSVTLFGTQEFCGQMIGILTNGDPPNCGQVLSGQRSLFISSFACGVSTSLTTYVDNCENGGNYEIVIGSDAYGQFFIHNGNSSTTVQNAINAILPTGVTAIVILNGGVYTITIHATNAYEGLPVTLFTGSSPLHCGHIVKGTGTLSGNSNVDCNCDCRQGEYKADEIADDRFFVLPVFADISCPGDYFNDTNTFIFLYAGNYNAVTNGDFALETLSSGTPENGTWVKVATLNNNLLGTVEYTTGICQINYCGFIISWYNVLTTLGEGIYRFTVNGSYNGATSSYCFFSPPFCLKAFDCKLADGTVKLTTKTCGGTMGSVTEQGVSWSLCCTPLNGGTVPMNPCITSPLQPGQTGPGPFNDSLRFPGYFGRETADYQETNIKLATGIVQKTRQEAIKNFLLDSDLLPFWFHQRFYSYGLMADNLYISDYNMNNPNYGYKAFSIIRDSSYAIKYSDNSLRMKKIVGLKLKEGIQFTFKDGCC